MTVAEYLKVIDTTIKETYGQRTPNGRKILEIYKDVIFYLVEKDKLNLADEKSVFDAYLKQYKTTDLWKVSAHYRKNKHKPIVDLKI
jgi:hypothetical protein